MFINFLKFLKIVNNIYLKKRKVLHKTQPLRTKSVYK